MRTISRLFRFFLPIALIGIVTHPSAVEAAPKKPSKPAAAPARAAAKASAPTTAAIPAPSQTLLDTAAVRRLYLDGDFEEAIDKIETSLRYGKGHTHVDSVFAFKHLGVMYAAKYETREKGKYYMHQLLTVEPTARILDMYASDMIYMIFKNIKDEFDAARMKYDRADDLVAGDPGKRPDPGPVPGKGPGKGEGEEPAKPKDGKGGNGALYWIGATGALVAAGVTAYFVFSDEPKTVVDNHTIEF